MFNLPASTLINKIVPKNAFDQYTNYRQKRLFSDLVSRIVWLHKISFETVNLQGKEVQEIQIFNIELKEKLEIGQIVQIIDRAVPYHIIFVVGFEEERYISVSAKHLHPQNDDKAVIDYTFTSEWFKKDENSYQILLKGSLDHVFKDFCKQFTSNYLKENKTISEVVDMQKKIDRLMKDIENVKSAIAREKQFNRKVELNLKLKNLLTEYEDLML